MLVTGLHSREENHILQTILLRFDYCFPILIVLLQRCQTRGLLGANLHIGAMVLKATLHMRVIVPRAACGFGFGDHHLSGQRSLKYSPKLDRSPKKRKKGHHLFNIRKVASE